MSGCMWVCERGDKVSIHTNQYEKLDFLTAKLLKIQVFSDVTLCVWGYTVRITSQNASFLKRQCGHLWDRFLFSNPLKF
jgi:hypothetical protein